MLREQTPGRRAREVLRREKAEAEIARKDARFLTAEEVAKFLGVSVATIRSWSSRKSGYEPKIPHIKIGRNIIRYDRETVIAWMKAKEYFPVKKSLPGKSSNN